MRRSWNRRELHRPAVEWRLATTVVDAYGARWRIEEYFKALKTGCALEKRQLETLDALLNALGLFIPIAWNLLRLRVLSRQEQPASKVLSSTQLKVLRASSKKELPDRLTVRDAMLAIAKLGGHLKRNGDPGWITWAVATSACSSWKKDGRSQDP